MAWIEASDFRDKHIAANSTEISDTAIEDALKDAEDFIVRRMGGAVARAFINDFDTSDTSQDDEDFIKYRALRSAQDKLAFRALLLDAGFASRVRDGGVIESEKDLNDTATVKYESFARETESRRKALLKEALELIEPFQPVEVFASSMGSLQIATYSDWFN